MNLLNRSFYIITGIVLTLTGCLGLYLTYDMYTHPIKESNFSKMRIDTRNACYKEMPSKGFNRILDDNDPDVLIAYKYSIENWKASIYSASLLISECDGMTMEEFCIGTECKVNNKKIKVDENGVFSGVYLRLKYDKSTEKILSKDTID